MYRNTYQYPSLAGRPRAEQQQIIRAALKEYGKGYQRRFLIFLVLFVVGLIYVMRYFRGIPVSDARFWIPPLIGGVTMRLYLLWETNGAIHDAVKKYLANKKT